jgi:hypothetical protein
LNLHGPAKQIENALNVLWYGFGQQQPWKNQCNGAVIKAIQSMRGGTMRQCKGLAGLPTLEKNKQAIGFKSPAEVVPWTLDKKMPSQAYIKDVFGKGFNEICDWPDSLTLKKNVAEWDSVMPFNMPKSGEIERLPFDPKKKTWPKFHQLGLKSQTLNVLLPLWNYRTHMKNAGTKQNFIKFFFHKSTSATAEKWVKGLIARLAVLYKSVQFKANAVRQQNVIEGVVEKKKTAVSRGSIDALRGPFAEQGYSPMPPDRTVVLFAARIVGPARQGATAASMHRLLTPRIFA